MKQHITDRLDAFRAEMKKRGITAAIVPQTDPHQSEYLADHWEVRRFLSGFTGSAGTLVVTADSALLWVDSRYFIQGAQQLEGTPIKLMKIGLPGTPTIEEYLISTLRPGDRVGIDGMLFSSDEADDMINEFGSHGIALVTDFDVIDNVWHDRPALPKDKIFIHDEKYAGESARHKLDGILRDVKSQNAESVFISPLDEIAWALNIRCNDVTYNPVAMAYMYVSPSRTVLFIDTDKVGANEAEYLKAQGVEVKPYNNVKGFIDSLPTNERVLVEKGTTSITLAKLLGGRVVEGKSTIAVPKACKNEVQIAGMRAAMERDGVALVKAHKELEEKMTRGERVTELDFDAMLRKYRSEQPLYFEESFASIVGYGPHGAIVHYEPTEETDVVIEPHGLLLVDSGAQYMDGTTDITRTIAMGEPTAEEKRDFTLVLKGTIALDAMVYPVGTRGAQLDVEARKYLWREGLTYLHGTGHGVGHFLNVHEGPQAIRLNNVEVNMLEGMITSDEPGLYRENKHGVRCENLVLTVKAMSTEFGDFLKHETLTLFPFDLTLVDTSLMNEEEIDWLNNYHSEVRRRLSPYLNDDERQWLENKTQPIKK